MPIGFGFSVGDFVGGISLVRDLIKALQESGGSSKEYIQLIVELRSLESALVEVKSQYDEVESRTQRVALAHALQACEESIDDFLRSIESYHRHLNIHGTNSRFRDALHKIKWHLTKADALVAFRARISAHVQSIQTILITIQVSSAASIRRLGQGQEYIVEAQGDQINSMNNSLILINSAFQALREKLVDQGSISEQTLASVDAVRHTMIASNVQMLAAIKQLQDSIPPQVLLQKPVIFLDALNRVAPVHLEWINTWEAFLAVLELRFKHMGRRKIIKREFVLQDSRSRRAIIMSRPLDMSLTPGQHLDMSMIFRDEIDRGTENDCPHCHEPCEGSSEDEIECPNCNCHFHRIQLVHDQLPDSASTTSPEIVAGSLPHASRNEPRSGTLAIQSDDARPSDFMRLRLMWIESLQDTAMNEPSPEDLDKAVGDRGEDHGLDRIDPFLFEVEPEWTDLSSDDDDPLNSKTMQDFEEWKQRMKTLLDFKATPEHSSAPATPLKNADQEGFQRILDMLQRG